jgi:hypothetical protein
VSEALKQTWALGAELWPVTYGRGLSDNDAGICIAERLLRGGAPYTERPDGPMPDANATGVFNAAAKWVHGGCRMLDPEPKAFAAFAFTSINRDSLREVRVPWPVFAMKLPSLESGDGNVYTFALFSQFAAVSCLARDGVTRLRGTAVRLDIRSESGPMLHRSYGGAVTLADLFDVGDDEHCPLTVDIAPEAEGDSVVVRMVLNAAFGCLYSMQHTRNWRAHPFECAGRKLGLRDAPPPHRNIVIGSPIKLDLMPVAREAATGRAQGAPAFQTLVRGHYKRQVIGNGRSGRKVIWVEPYWRGPEDAPILSRPYKVTAKERDRES